MSKDSNSTVSLLWGSVAVASIGMAYYYSYSSGKEPQEKKKKFHVDYHESDLPTAVQIIGLLPESIRHYLMILSMAPKVPKDGCDVLSDYDPYTKKEMVPNKIWRVRYEFIMDVKAKKELFELLGIDLTDPTILDRTPNEQMRKVVDTDLKLIAGSFQGKVGKNDLERLQANLTETQDMLVCRLDDTDTKQNGLLLYNPCRMHPSMVDWLNQLGTVEWIVSGSASHTNQVPQAVNTFPSAKVMCAQYANRKCQAVGMRPADYLCDTPEGFREAQSLLQSRGVTIHHVQGDCLTQALCVLAHRHLFEVDLLYGRHCGTRITTTKPTDWESDKVCGNMHLARVYYYSAIAVSPNGCIPPFRFQGMDPNSVFAPLLVDKPKDDGSSCTDMAVSLRALLKLDFDFVDSVHSNLQESLPADEFRKSMDKDWTWLDGNSLLE